MIAPAQTFGSSEREPSRTTRLLLKKKCEKYLTLPRSDNLALRTQFTSRSAEIAADQS